LRQYQLLHGFSNLCVKGRKTIEASELIADVEHHGSGKWFARRIRSMAKYYRCFGELPPEMRGGFRSNTSKLSDPNVKRECRKWLTSQRPGTITPAKFRAALNHQILPFLDIILPKELSERTACRWLNKLGYVNTVLRKGIYYDGHEREDVVDYRNNTYLPLLHKYEDRMVQYHGPDLVRTPPKLAEGEKQIIANFHDECSFHGNDFRTSAWSVNKGSMPLQKKGRGRLIHVSDFINEEDGRLVERNDAGEITDEARVVIFPGANGDRWWDGEQMRNQLTRSISLFERIHPDCQGLWIFEHSSNHAALGDDALKAFDMNKSDGGKQRKQRDTIFPLDCPAVERRGTVQRMTTDDGKAKGLETVLTERGFDVKGVRGKYSPVCSISSQGCCMARILSQQDDFANQVSMLESIITKAGHLCLFLPKFHCDLNPIEMYWGYSKYRYRQVVKPNFEAAKIAAFEALDSCPKDTIRRFINRTWRMASAYRQGLTGKAAEWAVKKQRSHRSVSERARVAIKALAA
ncbi:hypothetical protein DL93DRAFT_2066830, partial [Clavulina sp. PMI_390]